MSSLFYQKGILRLPSRSFQDPQFCLHCSYLRCWAIFGHHQWRCWISGHAEKAGEGQAAAFSVRVLVYRGMMGACVVMNAEGACLSLNIHANPSQSIGEILGIIFLTIISETCKVKNMCSCAVKITFPCLYLEFPFFPGHVPHKKRISPTPQSPDAPPWGSVRRSYLWMSSFSASSRSPWTLPPLTLRQENLGHRWIFIYVYRDMYIQRALF